MILSANTNMSLSTTTGIMSIKSGGTTNIGSVGAVIETYEAGLTTNITGTLDLNASVEVDIDSALINLN